MTTTPRPRFTVRAGLTEAPEHDGPFEGMPGHLTKPLQEWVGHALESRELVNYSDEEDVERTICLRLRMSPPQRLQTSAPYHWTLTHADGADLLDVVDAVLAYKVEREVNDPESIRRLSILLDEAGSAYRVAETLDGLEERVTPGVRDAVRRTVADAAVAPAAGSAADHLAAAWQAAYGRSPDPTRAYSEAIKAVESAAHTVVQPNNTKATLGSMLGEIKNVRHKFTTAIPTPSDNPIAPAEAMMRALWEGQTSRHGAQSGTVPETLEAARAGVHLAATLVQWFVSGAVARS
ncbi:hypothetical protein OG379_40405 (plasmid) [Streptomyces sp. NBC_01166]|uniref:hypothetical protein n=1 Tax=Streptomyces sp. NBC_01166 TaxID=2903755 RepID=UPI00386F3FBD|nr:hypothetical protein OG379_40405 [Streptomyces sp. NBC_01166]